MTNNVEIKTIYRVILLCTLLKINLFGTIHMENMRKSKETVNIVLKHFPLTKEFIICAVENSKT